MAAASRNASSDIRSMEVVPRYMVCRATEKNMHNDERHKKASVVFIQRENGIF